MEGELATEGKKKKKHRASSQARWVFSERESNTGKEDYGGKKRQEKERDRERGRERQRTRERESEKERE